MISRRDKQRAKKANQASLLIVENSHNSIPKEVVEVKDRWLEVRVTSDSGSTGHVVLEAMFPRVKLERKTSANGEKIIDLGEKNIPFKTFEGIQRCTTFKSASVVKPFISVQKVVRARNIVVTDEKNPHIETFETEQWSSWT